MEGVSKEKKGEGKVRNDGRMAGGVEGGGIRRFLYAKVPRIPSKLLFARTAAFTF